MREIRSSGSVEGVMSNRDPYSDFFVFKSARKLWTVRFLMILPVCQAFRTSALSEPHSKA